MVEQDVWGHAEPDEIPLEVADEDRPGRAFNQIGPFAITPVWIFDPSLYLPGVPGPLDLKPGDEKPLTGSEIRVYVALKSYANTDGYARPFVSTLAERAKVDKSSAERAIAKFKRLGWVTTKRKYRDDGSIRGCDYWVRDICPEPRTVTATEDVPVNLRVPHPRGSGEDARDCAGAKNTPTERTTRTDLGSDRISTTSSRFAPFGGGNTESQNKDKWAARDLNQMRDEDFDLFRSLAGDHLKSTGASFTQGTWTARQIYLGMMKWKIKKKPITWPGMFLSKIDDDGFGTGEQVEYFLATYGLEKVTP